MTMQSVPHAQKRVPLFPVRELEAAEAAVRHEPAQVIYRWQLFQWLCITCQWERAVLRLQVYARLDSSQISIVQACRDLMRAGHTRANVIAGLRQPNVIVDDVFLWMRAIPAALGLAGQWQIEAADDARGQALDRALDRAPLVAGRGGDVVFEWIADSDTRLRPVCKFITAERYRWRSLPDVAAWQIEAPTSLLDFIWAPCALTLTDGARICGFMPAHSPDCDDAQDDERDALLMARLMAWEELGRAGVRLGPQDMESLRRRLRLCELAHCSFASRAEATANAQRDAVLGASL
jgi:type VI secretion system protein ImpE